MHLFVVDLCLLYSVIYRLYKMENTRDLINAVFSIFPVTNRIYSRHTGSKMTSRIPWEAEPGSKQTHKNLGGSQCLLVFL